MKIVKIKHIVCFHLLNDYSGSPKVLHQMLDGLLRRGYRVDLVTSRGGVLDTLDGRGRLRMRYYRYRFSSCSVVTMLRYCLVQIYTFFLAFRYLFCRDVVFYVNTLLPVGPALAGRLMGKRVVYHYHENAAAKGCFYKILSWAMQRLASDIICVSEYQRGLLKRRRNVEVIPNSLPQEFRNAFEGVGPRTLPDKGTVLMLSSLKAYKGVLEFIELSGRMPLYKFNLVVNDTWENIGSFLTGHSVDLPGNAEIFARQEDVIPFYRDASLVVNLSDKELFVETFGLTVLEAMTAALPVIVPTVGGVAEMVEDGVNGYKIDVHDLSGIEVCVGMVLSDSELYRRLSSGAKQSAESYNVNGLDRIILLFS